ncbi:unnamed protein product [Closterium sp. Naga37s-1]|nr:unnamed protein product [Closterium sp. Naga37s-1]
MDAPSAEARPEPVDTDDEEEEEGDGYLSDDPEEHLDPVKAGEIAALAGYTLTLVIPQKYEDEVPRTIDTVKELLVIWRKALSPHAQTTTKIQVLQGAYLSKKRFGRLQVTFRETVDANYVWCRRVDHICVDGKTKLTLSWQHPENPLYIKERAQNSDAIDVLLKGVPAEISPDMIYKLLVKTPLEKRGRPPYQSGAAFHRVVDPVTGTDTHKIKGLVKLHPGDKYRWWHMLYDTTWNADGLCSPSVSSGLASAQPDDEEGPARSGCYPGFHGRQQGGLDPRPGVLREDEGYQFRSGTEACPLRSALHGTHERRRS